MSLPPTTQPVYHVYKSGRLTVIGFDGRQLNEPHRSGECRDQLLALLRQHECQVLVVDLTDVGIVSSWVLGILAAIHQSGVAVEVYHPSRDMRGVLSVTHLDELLHIRHEITSAPDASSTQDTTEI